MVYLPTDLRRAMAAAAAERGMKVSDFYAEATSAYLAGVTRTAEPTSPPATKAKDEAQPIPDKAIKRILKHLDNQSQMISDIRVQTSDLVPLVGARPLAIVIAAMSKAGHQGLGTPEVRALLTATGFRDLKTTTVRDALIQAGVARYEDGQWILLEVPLGEI